MILDSLKNSGRYESLHPLFRKAFDFLKNTDFSTIEDGKVTTDDPRLFFSFSTVSGKEPKDAKLETHIQYIDIQTPISAAEIIGWKAKSELQTVLQPYDAEKDVAFSDDEPTSFSMLLPGQFAIFFPEDGHAPAIGKGAIRKIIAKIAV
ncbi:MAG: YhcH/YjgK/YiaL family protein [Tannerella sp.]|jgi:YhcH/YjgK/YiaL family protein|nr:YhcH/YjgK/YiaL family protein [Tannerella sp.]